ncbi:MAG TPA: hypothetical protein VF465_16175 [Flavobacterium sp.]|uniref:hypothetical protein n=1 Tax=Flavobacterium sp. TaxID=239 RepID=UPI0028E64129|nr:hypothetical protein [uncultured Flavobacterium sp.]
MKIVKVIFVIFLMFILWFSKDVFWYTNFKNLYNSNLHDKIIDVRQGRGGKEIKIKTDDKYISLYSENDEYLKIGDSINKKCKSTVIEIFRRKNNKWNYFKSTFIRKDLDYYSFIVDEK